MSKEQTDLPAASEAQELPELLPCPMCGKREYVGGKKHLVHEPGEEDFYWGFNVICNAAGIAGTRGCGTMGGWGETPAEAIANWNRRASPSPAGGVQAALLDQVEAALIGVNHALMELPLPETGKGKRAWQSLLEAQKTLTAALSSQAQTTGGVE